MTVESIYRTSIDYHFFNYSQLDALAQVHNIPLSLLLIFTRVRSEMENVDRRRTNEAQRIVVAFRSAIDHLDGLVTRGSKNEDDIYEILNYEVFKEFIAIYLNKFDETLL